MMKKLNILIADDSEDDAFLIVRELRRGGLTFDYTRVDAPDAMLLQLEKKNWDLVITDHEMPSFSSTDALSLVKGASLDAPVIIVSGAIGEDLAIKAMKAGAQDYIMKDSLARLVPAVERELREAEHRDARRVAEQNIEYLSSYDSLTNLVNRQSFKSRVSDAILYAKQGGAPDVLLFLDLDQFKLVNDSCGNEAGDQLLKDITQLMLGVSDVGDVLSRWGGDEFCLLLSQRDVSQASTVAENLLEELRRYRFAWQGRNFVISASIGLVSVERHISDADEGISLADLACYAAKQSGGDGFKIYDPNDERICNHRQQVIWASRLRQALEDNRFVLYQQPMMGLNSQKKIRNHEFLLRFNDTGGVIGPNEFIPAAERFHLMTHIDRWVVEYAFEYVAGLLKRRSIHELGTYFINLSGVTVGDKAFFSNVLELQRRWQLPPELICFEITETAAIANLQTTSEFIKEVRDVGFRFALDDFGVGMSSFAYLKAIPVDYLKIDGGFVRSMLEDRMDYAVVEACHNIAQAAGLQTVAEFVENDALLRAVESVGVDFAQGYGIERPHPLPR